MERHALGHGHRAEEKHARPGNLPQPKRGILHGPERAYQIHFQSLSEVLRGKASDRLQVDGAGTIGHAAQRLWQLRGGQAIRHHIGLQVAFHAFGSIIRTADGPYACPGH